MSTKALKRELFAAIVMLLVAAIALSGSTFAWFANNTVVTAEGAQVVAETAKNLAIKDDSEGGDNEFKTAVSFEGENVLSGGALKAFNPVTAVDVDGATPVKTLAPTVNNVSVTGIKFYGVNTINNAVVNPADHAAEYTMGQIITTSVAAIEDYFKPSTNDYWNKTATLLFTAVDGATTLIDADIIVETTSKEAITDALHIAFVGDGTWYQIDMGSATKATSGAGMKYTGAVSSFVELEANVAETIGIYMWYEGEDTDCFSNNAIAADNLKVYFSFKLHE